MGENRIYLPGHLSRKWRPGTERLLRDPGELLSQESSERNISVGPRRAMAKPTGA